MAENINRNLRDAYEHRAEERDRRPTPAWEAAERDAFLHLVTQEGKQSLLELGAGTGNDSRRFADAGLDVVCIDLSPAMVAACRAKGLAAHVMDVASLRFASGSFDAVYAMNCLVHLPKRHLAATLEKIFKVLAVGGAFYLGLYGGRSFEGIWEDDGYEPKRFFSHYPDDELTQLLKERFAVESFRCIENGWAGLHFQSFTLRKLTG